ncbi:hypothetical protein LWI29_006863 [Acer saccharum]|uniref:Uncharacterized protein n=1 Tax=Acer saccharum TaxID=4024 RepID=A0AA39T587_ACESA|nr:hypothetical protein LWI29_006863 [Acer saccharum]
MNPPLPQHYFGNATEGVVVCLKAKELLEQGHGYVAWEINKIIAMHTDEKFIDMLESWTRNPKVSSLGSHVSNALILSGSLWVDLYGNDFGWGRPIVFELVLLTN